MNAPTIYDIVTFDKVLSQFYRERPITYWEIGRDILEQLGHLKDDLGFYAMSVHADRPDTLFGIPYRIVDGRGLRLVTEVQS